MTNDTLSNKLFVQKDGKKFAYADDIKKSIKKLKKKEFIMQIPEDAIGDRHGEFIKVVETCEIDKTFGDELK